MHQSNSRWRRGLGVLLVCGAMLCMATSSAWASITGGFGNDPLPDHNWPDGALAVANLKSRVGWWEGPPFGGGEYHFLYRGDAKALNEALEALSKINAPAVEVEVQIGPHDSFWLEDHDPATAKDSKKPKRDPRVDWEFVVWTPANYHHLFNNPNAMISADQPNFRKPIPAPKLEVYIGGGLIDWKDVKVPDNVKVIDRRAERKAGINTAAVNGRVYNMITSKPVIDAKITLLKHSPEGKQEVALTAKTDAKGMFRLDKIPADAASRGYTMWIEAEGLVTRNLGWKDYHAGMTRDVVAYLSPPEKVEGQVIDDQKRPVVGATVMVNTALGIDGKGYTFPNRAQTKTDATGHFRFELPQGAAYISSQTPEMVQKGFPKLFDIGRDKVVTIELEPR